MPNQLVGAAAIGYGPSTSAMQAAPGSRVEPPDRSPRPRVLVVGSWNWQHRPSVWVELTRAWRELGRPIELVTGGAPTGAELLAREWAAEHAVCDITASEMPGLRVVAPFVWERPPARVLAFIRNGSPTASGVFRRAQVAGLDVRRFDVWDREVAASA
ncbi:MAG TPA: SLOG family protein [Nocardioides sp.]